MALSYRGTGRCSQDARKHSTIFQQSHVTQSIPRSSAAMMARNGQAEPMNLSTNLNQAGPQTLASSSTVPQKRKGGAQLKFYAVKAGHIPGVYLSWKECEQNISGFRGAACEYVISGK